MAIYVIYIVEINGLINLFNYDDRYDWIDLDDLLYYELNLNIIIDINYIYI